MYKFILEIGFTPAKTKTIGAVKIPPEYFFDFLRGHHDGDGSFYSYWDTRWRNSFMYYLTFISASEKHICWLRKEINEQLQIKGHLCTNKTGIHQLRYAKNDSFKLLKEMYYDKDVICLTRKRLKIEKALGIIGEHI